MVTVLERDDPPRGAKRTSHQMPRRRHWPRVVLAVMIVAAVVVGGCVVDALRVPGTDGVAAKLAEWGRSHDERQRYRGNGKLSQIAGDDD